MINSTKVLYFVFLAYFDTGSLRYLHASIVMLLYTLILCFNLLLIVVICMNRSLHEPMFVFLCSLFVNQLFGSTGLFPFLLVQILSDFHTTSVQFCFLQIFCLYAYGKIEFLSLAAISYDRYLAICNPLHYARRMTLHRVVIVIIVIWVITFLLNAFGFALVVPLQLCGEMMDKVYCSNYDIVKLACSYSAVSNMYGLFVSTVSIYSPLLLILYTYTRIFRVCISGSRQTRQKAVSTCTPHLASLINFTFGVCFEIIQSRFDMSNVPNILRIFLSLYFLTCPPLFNPLIYGLNLSKIRNMCKSLM